MLKLDIDQILSNIQHGITFESYSQDDSFYIKIEEYVPFICTAIHSGHNLRDSLLKNILLDEHERWYEEDPYTDVFISSLPIVMHGNDSRYEYDLNRNPKECIYKEAWGKKIWKTPLTTKERNISLRKHANFYKVLDGLVAKIEQIFTGCLVYDMHSYNYLRHEQVMPVFNIGTERIDHNKFDKFVNQWKKDLAKIKLPNIDTTVEINGPFYGRGFLLENLTQKFNNTLVLATEVKKIYGNEETSESYPLVISALDFGMKKAILNTTAYFATNFTNLKVVKKSQFLSSELEDNLLALDKRLFNLTKRFEILNHINPVNLEREKKKFIKSGYKENPEFKYRQLLINPYKFKRELYSLPVEDITDISIQKLYKDVIKAYTDKVDMLSSIGTKLFLYNSLRYFGQPSEKDIANADFILSCPDNEIDEENLTAEDVKDYFTKEVDDYGFKCKIEISTNIAAKVMVLNYQRLVRLKKGAMFSENSITALTHHEIGVHMVTTINATHQPLNIFRLGLPVNTLTQEGLAVLSEYLSGSLTIKRLKELALRVKATDMMVKGYEFKEIFLYLLEEQNLNSEAAFILTARIFRSGGFTKDHLYLKGFIQMYQFFKEGKALDNLLIGKMSHDYIDVINEMVERRLIFGPKYKTKSFNNVVESDTILNYILSGLKTERDE